MSRYTKPFMYLCSVYMGTRLCKGTDGLKFWVKCTKGTVKEMTLCEVYRRRKCRAFSDCHHQSRQNEDDSCCNVGLTPHELFWKLAIRIVHTGH